jgi:hypothetical protein
MSYSDDDNCSVVSKMSTTSQSATNQKMVCNFCKEEFQQRAIFNHLRKKHTEDFILNIDVKNLKEAIDSKTYYTMDLLVPDERDESECRFLKVYCIFGKDSKTNRGFLATNRAEKYIKETPTAIKEHLSQMKTLLDVKLKDISKRTILRGSTSIQINLKLAYHFINYSDSPLKLLKHKEKDTSTEEVRKEDLHKQFLATVAILPSDPKRPLTEAQIKKIFEIKQSAERFFDGLVGWVDRVYEYPPWVETLYQTVCNENSPDGRRYGEERQYFKTLSYPGDIGD